MKRLLLVIFVVFMALVVSRPAAAQQVQVQAGLSQRAIRIGDQTQLRLSVYQPAKAVVSFPQLKDTVATKIQIVNSTKADTVIDNTSAGMVTINKNYIITAFDAGTYVIPAFSFGVAGEVVNTEPLQLLVQTVKVDTTKAIYDIKQPLAVSYTWWDWLKEHWLWIIAGLAIAAVLIGLIWYLANGRKLKEIIIGPKPQVPFDVIALNKLNDLRDKKLWQAGQTKTYYIELSDIVREYLEKRYSIQAHEQTTDEIFVSLRHQEINQDSRNLLSQLLLLSDLVKFAKEQPLPNENEQSLENAIAFVSHTRPVEKPMQPAREGGPDELV